MKLNKFLTVIIIVIVLAPACIFSENPPQKEKTKSGVEKTMEMCLERHGKNYKVANVCYRAQERAADILYRKYFKPIIGKYKDEKTGTLKPEASKDKKVHIINKCSKSWRDHKGRRDWIMVLRCVENNLKKYEKYMKNHRM